MWRIAGDTSTDFNHYTKRMTLGAVYGSTLLAWLDDQSEGWTDTGAFLDRRIDDVMKIREVEGGVARIQEHFSVYAASSAGCAIRRADHQLSRQSAPGLVIDNQLQE